MKLRLNINRRHKIIVAGFSVTRYTLHKMKILVGLGNPGEKYALNRHNVGFMFVEYLFSAFAKREAQNVYRFKRDKDLQSDIAIINVSRYTLHDKQHTTLRATRYTMREMIIVKPQTYMNKSGDAVAACVSRFALHDLRNDLIVVHDDLDIPFGKFKIQMQGPKQHNGLTDIQNKLRTMDFLRVRIGIDNRLAENRINGEEYVLQNFTEEERAQLPEVFERIEKRFEEYL